MDTPDGSRFCGICGYKIDAGQASRDVGPAPAPAVRAPAPARPARPGAPGGRTAGPGGAPGGSGSVLELPVSRGAWLARVVALLALDATLLVAGVVLILGYVDTRAYAAGTARAAAARTDPVVPGAGERGPGHARATGGAGDTEAVASAVAIAVDRARPDIQRCYAEASQAEAGALPEGRLDIGLTVAADGSVVRAAAVIDDMGRPGLTGCVETLFRALRLPARPAGKPVDMVWPLRFKAPR